MLSFQDFILFTEQDPLGMPATLPGGGAPPGGPPMDMGGLGGPPGMGGPMGGAPGGAPGMGGPVGGQVPTIDTTPIDVWSVLEKILEGKPIKDTKKSRPNQQDMLSSSPAVPPAGAPGAMPPATPPPPAAGMPAPAGPPASGALMPGAGGF